MQRKNLLLVYDIKYIHYGMRLTVFELDMRVEMQLREIVVNRGFNYATFKSARKSSSYSYNSIGNHLNHKN